MIRCEAPSSSLVSVSPRHVTSYLRVLKDSCRIIIHLLGSYWEENGSSLLWDLIPLTSSLRIDLKVTQKKIQLQHPLVGKHAAQERSGSVHHVWLWAEDMQTVQHTKSQQIHMRTGWTWYVLPALHLLMNLFWHHVMMWQLTLNLLHPPHLTALMWSFI